MDFTPTFTVLKPYGQYKIWPIISAIQVFSLCVCRLTSGYADAGLNIEDNVGASVPSNDYSNGTMRDENSQIASVGKGSLPVESVGATKPYGINLDSRVGVQLPVPPQDSNGTLYDKRPPTSAQLVGVSQAESVDKSPEPHLEGKLGVVLPVESVDDCNEKISDQNSLMAAESVVVSGAASIAKAPVPGQLVEASINGVQVPVPSHGTLHDQKSPLPGQSVVSITVTTQSPAPEIDDAGMGKTLLLYKTMIKKVA